MLSISEFSEMCHLSPQALRFYHAEGLLTPAEVDPRTGYRMYAFPQVEQAMLITLLRDTGMSVKLVRQALDEPDQAVALLDRHEADVRAQRTAQDEAVRAARALFGAQPEPLVRHVPACAVVSTLVYSEPLGRTAQEWDEAEGLIAAAEAELRAAVAKAGGTCNGRAWRTLPLMAGMYQVRPDGTGPFWLVEVPVTGLAPEAGLEVRQQPARDEVQIFMPGRPTMAKYCTVMLRLMDVTMPDGDGRFVNVARLRQEVHEDGVLTCVPLEHPRIEPD